MAGDPIFADDATPARGSGPRPGDTAPDAGSRVGGAPQRILDGMTQPGPDLREDTTAMLAAAGITVTEEGRARARKMLDDADRRRSPERRAALRARLGLSPASAA
jgi:hypothetical protein